MTKHSPEEVFELASQHARALGCGPNSVMRVRRWAKCESFLHEIGHFWFLVPESLEQSIADTEKLPRNGEGHPRLGQHDSFAGRYDYKPAAKAWSMSEAWACAFSLAVMRSADNGNPRDPLADKYDEFSVRDDGYSNSEADNHLNMLYLGWEKLIERLVRSRNMGKRLQYFFRERA
jgi:hypothetical protein